MRRKLSDLNRKLLTALLEKNKDQVIKLINKGASIGEVLKYVEIKEKQLPLPFN